MGSLSFVENKKFIGRSIQQNYIKKRSARIVNIYDNFMPKLRQRKILLVKKILNFKSLNYTIVGVGAAAKANTFINYMGFIMKPLIS